MARDQSNLKAARTRWFAAIAGVLLTAGCAPDAPIKATDPAHPTIVSLNPCIDAILVEVAGPDQVLALSHYSRDPGSSSIAQSVAARYGVMGGTAEEVIALQPDVVIASTFLPQPTRNALERAGLRVETFGSPTTIAASIAQVRQVASLVGAEGEGETLVRQIAGTPQASASTPITTLLWQPGEIVAGEATLIAELMRQEGFANHAAARGLSQADHVSLESVLADPPRILLVAGDQAGQMHPLLDRIRNTMVVRLDPSLLYCGGPTIPKVRKRLADIRDEYERSYYQGPD